MTDLIIGERFVTCSSTLETIMALRHRVLLPDSPISHASFEGDTEQTTCHLATLYTSDAQRLPITVCCATLTLSQWDNRPARQLRGMATDPLFQGRGLGTELMLFAEQISCAVPYTWWCNARVSAVPFYRKLGWSIVSDEFDIPVAGPHVKMLKQLT